MKTIQFLMLLLVAMCAFTGMYTLTTGNYGVSAMFLLMGTLGMVIYTYVERKEQEEIVKDIFTEYDAEEEHITPKGVLARHIHSIDSKLLKVGESQDKDAELKKVLDSEGIPYTLTYIHDAVLEVHPTYATKVNKIIDDINTKKEL